MQSIRFRAETPPKERWLIFDCSLLTIEELKDTFEILRNSPSSCDTDIDHVMEVYREKKSEAKKAERDRKSKGIITSIGSIIPGINPMIEHEKGGSDERPKSLQNNYLGDIKQPLPPPINPNFQLFPDIKLPNISWVFGANKGTNEKHHTKNIPLMKKLPKKEL